MAPPAILRGRYRLFAQSPREYSSRTIELVGRSLVIDMLNPFGLGQEQRKRWLNAPETFAGADLERYRSSGIQVFHIAIGTGGPEAFVESLKHIGSWNGFVANHDQYLLRIDSPGDLDRVKGSGKLGILLGLQNSEHFGTLEDVNLFHGMGQRVSQLTYNARNLTVAVRPKGGTMG